MDDSIERVIHERRVKQVLATMPKDEDIFTMAARFKCLAEPSRLKILFALSDGELCVEHIVEAVAGNQSAVSHQLKTLKDNRIIKCRREGKNVLYSVSDEHIMMMLTLAKEHLNCNE
jgi:ArsR family transcriptional regulator